MELFCTRMDIIAAVKIVETRCKLTYARMGLFQAPSPETFSEIDCIPGLGEAPFGNAMQELRLLIARASTPILVRSVPQQAGGVRYAVDQQVNPDTATLRPGGLHGDSCLIAGQLGTIGSTSESSSLYQLLKTAIARTFKRVRLYWVGPEAFQWWRQGMRLTFNAQASRQFDLQLPDRG